jgi:hypothetical protein
MLFSYQYNILSWYVLWGELGSALTDQLVNTIFICICPRGSETSSFVCVGAQENRDFGDLALLEADLGILGDECAIDCGEPF